MDKEFTYFIVDLSPSMLKKQNGRQVSDLEYGLKYLYSVIAHKILKAKKSDQVSVILLHHTDTDNPLSTDDENTNIKILNKEEPASFDLLARLNSQLQVNESPFIKTEGDVTKLLLVACTLLYEKTKTSKKLVVNVVVLTNCESPMDVDEELGGYMAQILQSCNEAKIHVASIDFETDTNAESIKSSNESKWRDMFSKVNNGSSIFHFDQLLTLTTDIEKAIPRIVRPVKIFDGELRLGCDLDAIDSAKFEYNKSAVGSSLDLKYDQFKDPISLCMKVEGWPLIKKEALMSAKTYTLSDLLHPVKFIKDYKIHDSQRPEDETAMKSITLQETVNVFKYGSSVTPLTTNLEKAAKFRTYAGIDIRGIIKLDDLPVSYLTDESILILNKVGANQRDTTSFNSLCVALLNLGSVAIVRYVQKDNSEVQMALLIPNIVNSDRSDQKKRSTGDEGGEFYSFSLVRLPFKEDEKISNFSKLSRIIRDEADMKYSAYIPTPEMVDLMTEYVDLMDLDSDTKPIKESKYLTLNDYKFTLPVPYNLKQMDTNMTNGRLNKVTMDLRIASPPIHILQAVLSNILVEFAAEDSETSIADKIMEDKERVDSIIKKFNENLQLSIDKNGRTGSDIDLVKKMTKLFDNKPVVEQDKHNRHVKDEIYTRDHENDDDFDIDAILAKGTK